MMQMHRPQKQKQQQKQQQQPQQQQQQEQDTKQETQIKLASGTSLKSSTNFIKRLTALSVSTVSYLRNIFPDEAYGDKRLGKVALKVRKRAACRIDMRCVFK